MANLLSTTVNGALNSTGRITASYDTDRYQMNFYRASASNWWVTNDSGNLGFHLNNVGDRFYFGTGGDFWSSANGWLSTALAGKLSTGGTAANSSQLEGFSAYGLVVEARGAHSGSDFVNGTLVQTDINADVWAGDSFVMEVSGKSYGSGTPFKLVMEGYLYADTIINVSAMSYGSYFPAPVKVMRYNGNVAFWWPRGSYWNSFLVHVRNANGDSWNRVTSITDSVDPASADKKISITPVQVIHTNNIGSQSVSYASSAGNSATTSQRSYDYLYASSYLESGGAVYGTIFYDNNDRGYYADFNSTGNTAIRVRGGMLMGPNPTWGAYLQVGGDGNNGGSYANVVTTNGNLHLDSANGYSTYINHYYGGKIFFGSGGAGGGLYNHSNFSTTGNLHLGGADADASYRLQVSGTGYATSDFRAPIFYDSGDTGYYLDPNDTSNLNQLNTATRTRWNMPRYWTNRTSYTSDEGYWTGTNGWGKNHGTWANAWQGGFSGWDIWGEGTDHPQGAGYVHAQGIVSGQHYANSSVGYGWMMVGAANATDNRYWLRGKWDTTTSGWVEMITTGNIASQSVNYASNAGNADTLDSLDSSEFARGRAAYQVLNLDTVKQPGLYQYDGGIGGTQPEGTDQANLRTIEIGSGGRYTQMAFDWASEQAWFRRQTGSEWSTWREFIHAGNIGSQSVSYASSAGNADTVDGYHATNAAGGLAVINANGYWYPPSWINVGGAGIYSGTNNAHFLPNNNSAYGSWEIIGSRGGWSGIYFRDSGNTLMANPNDSGFYNVTAGWQIEWYNGNLYISKQANGGGALATVIDSTTIGSQSVNYASSAGNADTVDSLHASSFVRKDTTNQYLKPYYEYSSYLTSQRPIDLVNEMGGGGLRVDFLNPSYTANGNWGHVITWSGYNGYTMYQLSGSYGAGTGAELFMRNEADHNRDSWSSWRRLLNNSTDAYAANMNQYLRTTDGPTFANVYTAGWFRNYGNQGIYNQDYGTHFYSNGGANWVITGSGGNVELQFRSNHQSTLRGWVYATTSNEIGFLSEDGNWVLRTWNRGVEAYGSMRAPIYYDSSNTNRYLDLNSTAADAMVISGGIHISRDNVTGNGIILADDGDIVDLNDGYCAMRFSYGIRIHSGNRAGGAVHTLHSDGNAYFNTSAQTPIFLVNNHSDNTKGYRIYNTSNSSVSAMFVNSSNQLVIAAGAVDQINLNKKVYVNGVALGVNVAPSATAGRIDASNDIVAYSSSDERLKYNITPIENAIDKVKSLTGVEFDWKPEYKHAHGYEGHDTGIIAQQVQEVIPSAVRTNDTGFLAVRYEKLIGLLVEGMKEQQAQIEELKAKLDGLTK